MSAIQPLQSSATTFDVASPFVDGGDLGAEIAALAIQNGNTQRATAHAQRAIDEADQERADAAQVQAIHSEASSMRAQAWVDGGIGVAAAFGDAFIPRAPTGGPSGWGAASTDLTAAATKMVDGFFAAAQHDDEADAASDKAAADRFANDAKDASDAANDATATINTALDFARSYVATEAQTQAAALHRA
jgi:hypothetical protein